MKTLTFIFLVIIPWGAIAQKYTLQVTDVDINGTSNLHDWTMTSNSAQGEVGLVIQNFKLVEIEQLHFKIAVKSLKSGKKTMDNICYDALKEEQSPIISFQLSEILSIENGTGEYTIKASGWLNIAGVVRLETITATGSIKSSGIEFTGTHQIKMTTYKVEPPTALFGTLKTGDKIEVVFRTTFSKPDA